MSRKAKPAAMTPAQTRSNLGRSFGCGAGRGSVDAIRGCHPWMPKNISTSGGYIFSSYLRLSSLLQVYPHRTQMHCIPLPKLYLQNILNGPGLCRYILDAGCIVYSTEDISMHLQVYITAARISCRAGYMSDTRISIYLLISLSTSWRHQCHGGTVSMLTIGTYLLDKCTTCQATPTNSKLEIQLIWKKKCN